MTRACIDRRGAGRWAHGGAHGWALAAALALAGCNFDPYGMGTAGPNLGGEDEDTEPTATDATSTSPTSDSTQGGGDEPDSGLDTTAGPTSDATTDPTGDDAATTGDTCMMECPVNWECVAGQCTNPDEGEPCEPMGCGPAAPFCAPNGVCYDGTLGDPCENGQCTGDLLCGPAGTCQAGNENEPCGEPSDCNATAPLCTSGACHDGGVGDPCIIDGDCPSILCGPGSTCQTGSEGEPCIDASDCAAGNYCPWDNQCHDGSTGDPCTDNAQCDGLTNDCIWVLGATICSF